MDYDELVSLRRHHPAWHLLRADSVALVASLLHRVFVAENTRTIDQQSLVEALDDDLYRIRQTQPDAHPRTPLEYLNDWSAPERGWLRKFYPADSDEPHYDLSPSAEKALVWLESLRQRTFVGTESRLLTMFELLRQMVEGSQEDPAQRIRTLEQKRAAIDAEIEQIRQGDVHVLDETALRDRYQQFAATARELLSDFREVEENFRQLDRGVREQIATWEGSRGALLDDVFGERDAIATSDQGVSFSAFWDFLMSSQRQEEFDALLDAVLEMPAVRGTQQNLRYVLHDWLRAGDGVQRTVAHLSQQLRRFLDDQAFVQNRRVASLIREIEAAALTVRDVQPSGPFTEVAGVRSQIAMPMSRPLHDPASPMAIDDVTLDEGTADFDTDSLYSVFTVDRERLQRAIGACLADSSQVSLGTVIKQHGLQQGLAELLTYLNLADNDTACVFVDQQTQTVVYDTEGVTRTAEIPTVIFTGGSDE
jgi:flagellar motility protein MotE (MotC chaperone)